MRKKNRFKEHPFHLREREEGFPFLEKERATKGAWAIGEGEKDPDRVTEKEGKTVQSSLRSKGKKLFERSKKKEPRRSSPPTRKKKRRPAHCGKERTET